MDIRELVRQTLMDNIYSAPVLGVSGAELLDYVDVRAVALDGMVAPYLGSEMVLLVGGGLWEESGYDVLAAPVLGGVLVALAMRNCLVELGSAVHVAAVRGSAKGHGLRRRIEGYPVAGERVLLVDDVLTTGESLVECMEILRSQGAEIVGCAVVVDRRGAEAEAAAELGGVPVSALFRMPDLVL